MSQRMGDKVGVIESRGIEPVPDEERHGEPLGLFWMWFGANMGVLGITLGAALVTFTGLNVAQAAVVAALGATGSFLLVGLLSTAGKRGGAPALTLSRAVFGARGNWAPTLVSWLGFVGWETVMCTTAAFALIRVLSLIGIPTGTVTTAACVLVVVMIAAFVGLFGHATVMWVQKWLSWVFGALSVVVVGLLLVTVDWADVLDMPAGPWTAVISGAGFIAAGTGLGWLSAGADYARYLPQATRSARIVAATVAGAALPLVVLISTGALMASGNAELAAANDPVAAIGAVLPNWMLIPYLTTAVFGLIAGADLSMYSSGLNLVTGGIRIRRTTAVAVDAVLITAGGLYITVVAQDFFGPFTAFLTLLAVPLTAWAAVFLVDMSTRRSYDGLALVDTTSNSVYWYRWGVNWPALVAWLAGIALGVLFTRAGVGDTVWFAGPWASTWVGQNSLGWLVAGVSAAALFSALSQLRYRPPSKTFPGNVIRRQSTAAAAGIVGTDPARRSRG